MKRKLIALLLAVLMLITCLPVSALADDIEEVEAPETAAEEQGEAGTGSPAAYAEEAPDAEADAVAAETTADAVISVPIPVKYAQTEARKQLQMINDFRTGSDAWAWDMSNSQKVYYSDLQPLEWDYELEKIAMQRAAELVVYFAHVRPDGTDCFSAYDDAGYTYWAVGENIAMGQRSTTAVFTAWQETDYDYSGQGHRRNMLSDGFTRFAAAGVLYNGTWYWVQEFADSYEENTETAAVDSTVEASVNIGLSETGWYKIAGNYYYVLSSGKLATGRQTIDGESYYFTESGILHIDHTWDEGTVTTPATCAEAGVKTYTCTICGETKTEAVKKLTTHTWDSGVVTKAPTNKATGVRTYTCTVCGTTKTEKIPKLVTGLKTISGKKYYFDDSGVMQTGWVPITKGKTTYRYYFGADGVMVTGLQTIDGQKYYFSTSGAMLTGLQTVKVNKVSYKYYFDPDTGVMQTGWEPITKGKTTSKYYFGADGVMVTGLQTIDGQKYYFNTSGVMLTGLQSVKVNRVSYKYYFDPDTGVMQTGWVRITKGKTISRYYFGADGVMVTGLQTIDGQKYYFSTSGVMKTGLQTVKENGVSNKYYFDPDTGAMQYGKTAVVSGKKTTWYYFDASGVMQKKLLITIDGKTYYFGANGAMATGKVKVNGVYHTFDKTTGEMIP